MKEDPKPENQFRVFFRHQQKGENYSVGHSKQFYHVRRNTPRMILD